VTGKIAGEPRRTAKFMSAVPDAGFFTTGSSTVTFAR
jgi:hypothetical protein